MNTPRFLLFGFGPERRKLVYARGRLLDAWTLRPVRDFGRVRDEALDPVSREVRVAAADGEWRLAEDASAVRLFAPDGTPEVLAEGGEWNLPSFEGAPHAAAMRRALADTLLCCTPWGPVPNPWAYPRPWYRDAAMAAMVLGRTGNLEAIRRWVSALRKPFDRNNAGDAEPDNLGEALYLVSLFPGAADHPLVPAALRAAEGMARGDGALAGRVDGRVRAVYPTKWLRFGLRALGLDPSKWPVPREPDAYEALFWMDGSRGDPAEPPRFGPRDAAFWPYLVWAEAHWRGAPPPQDPDAPPASWEGNASESDRGRLQALADAGLVPASDLPDGLFSPHLWHAAEQFLFFHDREVRDTDSHRNPRGGRRIDVVGKVAAK